MQKPLLIVFLVLLILGILYGGLYLARHFSNLLPFILNVVKQENSEESTPKPKTNPSDGFVFG